MMRTLAAVFAAMAVYGTFTGKVGPTIICVVMVVFVGYAARVLRQKDEAWEADPKNAKTPKTTQQLLEEQGAECTGGNFQA